MTLKKRSIVLPIGITAVVLVIGLMIGRYYISPSSYLSIDVNPSIEIHTNRLNQVTSVYPVNEDAKQLMSGYVLASKNLENVIEDIVDRLILSGYLTYELDNQILLTAGDIESSDALLEEADNIIVTYLDEKQLNAKVLQQAIDISTKIMEEAHESNVSAGKMSIIDKIIETDSTLSKEDLSDERISDLANLAVANNVDAITSATVKQTPENTKMNGANEIKSVSVTKPVTNEVDAITSATVEQPKENTKKNSTNESKSISVTKSTSKEVDAITSATVKQPKENTKKNDINDDLENIENYDKEDQEDSDYEDSDYEDSDYENENDQNDQDDLENDGENEDREDNENKNDNEDEKDGINEDREDNDFDEDQWQAGQNDDDQRDHDEDYRGNYEEQEDHDNHYGDNDDED